MTDLWTETHQSFLTDIIHYINMWYDSDNTNYDHFPAYISMLSTIFLFHFPHVFLFLTTHSLFPSSYTFIWNIMHMYSISNVIKRLKINNKKKTTNLLYWGCARKMGFMSLGIHKTSFHFCFFYWAVWCWMCYVVCNIRFI